MFLLSSQKVGGKALPKGSTAGKIAWVKRTVTCEEGLIVGVGRAVAVWVVHSIGGA